ncbi:MAG: M13 family metallopeptidase [Dokdonia sp.]
MRLFYLSCLAVVLGLFFGCDQHHASRATHWDETAVHRSHMDTTVHPGDDFYRYTNGGWLAHTQIPKDLPEYNTFYYLQNKVFNDLLTALERQSSSNIDSISNGPSKVALLYRQFLDTLSRNKTGITPILPVIQHIKKTESKAALLELIAKDTRVSAPFFTAEVGADLINSTHPIVYVGPHTLGLRHRDDYLSSSTKAQDLRQSYKSYINSILTEVAFKSQNSYDMAQRVLELEQLLAKAQAPAERLQHPEQLNNRYAILDANKAFPKLAPKRRLEDWGIPAHVDTLIITQPQYFKRLNVLLDSLPLSQLKELTVFHTLNTSSQILNRPLEKKKWSFYKSILQGAQTEQPARKRALQMANELLPEALGWIYAQRYGNEQTNAHITQMTTYIIAAYQKRIQALPWMHPDTKSKALQKLNHIDIKVGHPDSWNSYQSLNLTSENTYYENHIALRKWLRQQNMALLNQARNDNKWRLASHQVNAQYFPDTNQIIIPTAILQPPLYDAAQDMASNFGAIGAIIGHEITHAFDMIGARYDLDGNLNAWWTPEDYTQFNLLIEALNHQYAAIKLNDSLAINIELTRNENIADLGGIATAYDALQEWIKDHATPNKELSATPEQRFFMSWTATWRNKQRIEALSQQLKVDTHLPGQIRAVQPLRQFSSFYNAFDIGPGDPEYLPIETRVPIW